MAGYISLTILQEITLNYFTNLAQCPKLFYLFMTWRIYGSKKYLVPHWRTPLYNTTPPHLKFWSTLFLFFVFLFFIFFWGGGGWISYGRPSTFWPINQTLQINFSFSCIIFHRDLMKILFFPQNSYFFCDNATVQKFRLLHFVILLHATTLGMTLKGLLSICFQWSSILVGKTYLTKADSCKLFLDRH